MVSTSALAALAAPCADGACSASGAGIVPVPPPVHRGIHIGRTAVLR
ncbi:hypothetical protein FF36_05387 [Frankia torreyi]|uniref:Uncharacterized protein n=1 Tax=Frankia torreyi TaxID=1856 RepID=A0A0D8B8U0_9ACTN|nr:hypothetical protein FF36_05387 [Frankia torreyi]KQM02665.1 hypothetical protein FF86_105925 [Frankia sp. CpI1-P]